MAGIVSSVAPNHSTAQHATTATTSPEHHAPCAPVLPEPLQFSPPLQPPSRELQIAMPWHKCKASIMYSDTLCMSIAYLAAKYSIPLLSFEARAASHRGSTLYCTLHVYITWLVQIQRSGTSLTAWVTCKHCTCGGCHFLAFNVATVALEYNPIRSSVFDDRSSRYYAWRNSPWSRTFVPLTSSFA
ncbi:hypothetical protein CI102_14453 [Trichoderma harzianum]|nr:hypothetical protein CI102_14453 [Trichoderma harzianum]